MINLCKCIPIYVTQILEQRFCALSFYQPRLPVTGGLVRLFCRIKLYGERAFAVAAPTLWNKLPSEIKNSASVAAFKTS